MKNLYLRILLLSLLFCFMQTLTAQETIPESETESSSTETVVKKDEVPEETATNVTDKAEEETTEAAVIKNDVSPDSVAESPEPQQKEIADADTTDSLAETAVSEDMRPEKTEVSQADSVQTAFKVSGTVTSAETGDSLKGVTVFEKVTSKDTTTSRYGFYSMILPAGVYKLVFRYAGYKTVEKEIDLAEDMSLDIQLSSSIETLDKMVVVGEKKDHNITSTEMSVEKFDIEDIETIPVIMGEKDVMKTIQLVPGITSVTEGRSAIIVRGGSIDQNQIMMDGMPIYYFSHMNGLYSIFNSEAMEDMVVYKGGIPARYGGRAASFLDLTMKEANNKEFHMSAGVGLIASNMFIESPIIEDKLSFFVAGRTTRLGLGRMIDTILVRRADTAVTNDTVSIKEQEQVSVEDPRIFTLSGAYFSDLNGKIVCHINDKNSLYLSGYLGKDGESEGVYDFYDYPKEWGNRAVTLRWNHGFGPKMLSNTALIYSQYWTHSEPPGQIIESGVKSGGLRQEFSWFPNSKNTLMFGLCSDYLDFNHGRKTTVEESGKITRGKGGPGKFMPAMKSIESALFVSNDQKISSWLSAYYGLRYSMFHQIGSGYQVTYNEFNDPTDSVYFHRREIMQFYDNLEPRLSLNFLINEKNSIKFSYNRTAQYLRLMTNSMQLQYFDIWMPCTKNIKPLASNQIALGYFRNFFSHAVNFSVETFYKTSKGEFDFENGLKDYFQSNLEAYVATGRGRSYGLELMLKKPSGRFTGWASYNLGKSEIKIDGINENRWYDSKFDKTHDVTLVSNFKIFKNLSISGTWVYNTGNAVSLPEGVYEIDGAVIPYYSGRNEYRMPDYHRLDLGLILDVRLFKKAFLRFNKEFHTLMEFSLYNVYNRRNVNFIDYRDLKGGGSSTLIPFGISLYGIMPSFQIKISL